jgi:hypothetical protein
VPVPVVPHCPAAAGGVSGSTLGRVHLGMSRQQARHAYTASSTRKRSFEDFFCLTPTDVRVGYGSPKLTNTLSPKLRRHWAGKVVWISTSNPIYSVDGIRHGATLAAAQTALPHGNLYHVGKNDWFLAPNGTTTAMFRVQNGTVVEVGIAAKALTQGRKAQSTFVRSFY